jgi:hypothetical protein
MNMLRALKAGWLDDVTNWLRDLFLKIWQALVAFINDMIVFLVEGLLELIALAIESLPVPDFLSGGGIGAALASAGPTVMWTLDTFKISEGMVLIAAGYGFRLLRKFLTLFQW